MGSGTTRFLSSLPPRRARTTARAASDTQVGSRRWLASPWTMADDYCNKFQIPGTKCGTKRQKWDLSGDLKSGPPATHAPGVLYTFGGLSLSSPPPQDSRTPLSRREFHRLRQLPAITRSRRRRCNPREGLRLIRDFLPLHPARNPDRHGPGFSFQPTTPDTSCPTVSSQSAATIPARAHAQSTRRHSRGITDEQFHTHGGGIRRGAHGRRAA